jgi:hypothetical protein
MSLPSAPLIKVWPSCGQTSIQFFWIAPSQGAPFQKYTLACSDISYSQDISGDITRYTVTGLTAGTNYNFTITATNGTGTGPAAAFPLVAAGLRPFGPSEATASTVNASTAIVNWVPSTIANQAPTRWYIVTAQPSTAGASTLIKTEYGYRTSTFIKGISTNTYYRFLVQGVGSPGYCIPFAYTSSLGFGITNLPFSPSSLTNLALWLDATQITGYSNNQALTTWVDASPNTRSNAAVNSPTYQTNILNSQPVVRFNGGLSQYFDFGNYLNFGTAPGIAIFAVASYSNASDSSYIIAKSLYGPGLARWGLGRAYTGSNAMLLANTSSSGTVYEVTYADTATGARLHGGIWNRSTLTLYSNATQMATTAALDGGNGSNAAPLYVGAYGNGAGTGPQTGFYMTGTMGEVLTYSNVLTPFDRQKVEGYLGWKWGLQGSLPLIHPFKTAAPAAATVFSPSSFSSMQLWLDAADTTTLTGATAVSQWNDKSGRSNNVSQAVSGQQPVRYTTANGLTGLSYTASVGGTTDTGGQWFRGTFGTAITNNQLSIFTVGSMNSAAQNYGRAISLSQLTQNDFAASGGGTNIARNATSNQIIMEANGSGGPSSNISLATPFIAESIFDSANQTIFLNGTQAGTRAFTANFNIARSGIGFQAYQGVGTTSDRWDGTINEVLVYNRGLSTDDRQTVEGYLAWKWGLQGNLPTTHPYKYLSPASNYAGAVNPQGLIVRFDATTYSGSGAWSNTAALGTNFNATVENGTPSKNTAGNGVVFNGATNFTFSNPVLGNAWTAVAWVKRTGSNQASAAYLTQTGAGGGILNLSMFTNDSGAGVGTNQVTAGFYTGATWKTTTPYTLNQDVWYNLAYTWDGTTLVSYVNGVSTASLVAGIASSNNGNAYRIGRRWDTASYIVSEIGQMLIYNRGLSPTEVLQNYAATSNTFSV